MHSMPLKKYNTASMLITTPSITSSSSSNMIQSLKQQDIHNDQHLYNKLSLSPSKSYIISPLTVKSSISSNQMNNLFSSTSTNNLNVNNNNINTNNNSNNITATIANQMSSLTELLPNIIEAAVNSASASSGSASATVANHKETTKVLNTSNSSSSSSKSSTSSSSVPFSSYNTPPFKNETENLALPIEIRTRLHSIFKQIELEFDQLYKENIRLQQQLSNKSNLISENTMNDKNQRNSKSFLSTSPQFKYDILSQSMSSTSNQSTSLTSSITSSAVNALASTSSSAKSAILSSKTKINNLSFPKFRPNAREFIMQSLKNTSQQIVNKTQNHHSNVFSTKLQTSLSGHKDGIWDINCLQIPQYLLTNDINQQLNTNILVGTASADSTARLWYFNSHFIDGNCAGPHGISSNGCNQLSPLPQSTNQIFKFSSDKQMSTCSFCIQEYSGHTGSVNSIRFHPKFFTEGTNLILTGSGDCQAHIWQCVLSPTVDRQDNSNDLQLNYSSYYDYSMNFLNDKKNLNTSMSSPSPLVTNGSSMSASSSIFNFQPQLNQDLFTQTSIIRSPIKRYEGHTDACIAADWFPDGDLLATASWDRTANVYNVETGKILCNLQHDDYLTNVTIHRTNKIILTSSKDTTFKIWDFRDPICSVNVYQGHSRSVNSAIFINDDKIATSSDDQTTKLWDLRLMRSPICTINVNSGVNRICSININDSANSETLLCLPLDNRDIKIYNLQGERISRLPRSTRSGHKHTVTSVASCGGLLFSASFDKVVNCWYSDYSSSNKQSSSSKNSNSNNKENTEQIVLNSESKSNNLSKANEIKRHHSPIIQTSSSLTNSNSNSPSKFENYSQIIPINQISNSNSSRGINTLTKIAERIKN